MGGPVISIMPCGWAQFFLLSPIDAHTVALTAIYGKKIKHFPYIMHGLLLHSKV